MMESFHHEQLPVDGVVGLIQPRAGHRHPGVCKHQIPASLLVLKPWPYALAIGRSSRGGHMVGKATQPLAQRTYPHALPLPRPGPQGVELRAQALADRRRDRRQFCGELGERVAQAVAQARARQERPPTLGGAVEAIGEDPLDPVRRLLLASHALQRAIGRGQGRGTGVLGIAQRPEHPATDQRGPVHVGRETVTRLLVCQAVGGQRPPTPRQHSDQTVLAACANEALERPGRDLGDHRPARQPEPTVGGQQGIAGHLRVHLAIAYDDVGEDREHRTTRGALEPPDGESPQPDPDIMEVARQAPAPATGRLGPQLKAQGQDERDHPFDNGLAVVKQLQGGRFVRKINGDRPVFTRRAGGVSPGSPSAQMGGIADDPRGGSCHAISRES